jgi:hypothetical protein
MTTTARTHITVLFGLVVCTGGGGALAEGREETTFGVDAAPACSEQ